ncbi:hypothetical protein HPB50_015431 [Hyalomma asiaticum]|uniref:Uncharacterized protein n=1 Tax=Hyalomma asiaticum TaxID=266040 RepID=A0ACB7TI35_HYAAI|nr:hypothetical protein HPB50_015431 [Hyalomma asiaticum]
MTRSAQNSSTSSSRERERAGCTGWKPEGVHQTHSRRTPHKHRPNRLHQPHAIVRSALARAAAAATQRPFIEVRSLATHFVRSSGSCLRRHGAPLGGPWFGPRAVGFSGPPSSPDCENRARSNCGGRESALLQRRLCKRATAPLGNYYVVHAFECTPDAEKGATRPARASRT